MYENSGFEPDDGRWIARSCTDPSHNPPMFIFVPPGQLYRHVCPGCGHTTFLRSSSATL